jgi:hypothetical protein
MFLTDKMYDCYNYSFNNDKRLIEVKATKDGFICKKQRKQ